MRQTSKGSAAVHRRTWEANSEPSPPLDTGRTAAPAGCQGTMPALHRVYAVVILAQVYV